MNRLDSATFQLRQLKGGLASLFAATSVFLIFYWFMPVLWEKYVVTTGIGYPVGIFNAFGTGGLYGIGMSVILLKCKVFGSEGAHHPIFIIVNTLGGFLHLLSFTYYFNSFGVTLDTLYTLVGIFAWFHHRAWKTDWTVQRISWGILAQIVAVFLVIFVFVWNVWPGVETFARTTNFPFHNIGFAGGIFILASFIGISKKWIDSHGKVFAVIYVLGCVFYITNLMLDFNPFTVALQSGLIYFFLFPIRIRVPRVA
ncbi:MAG: hypothetical protein WCG55_03730 [bacterium]